MSNERTNRPIDEAELLGWIENDLPSEEHRRVSLALSRHPELRDRVEQMRADRQALRLLPDEPAPPGLLEGVADLLERELLVSFDAGPADDLRLAGGSEEASRGWLSPLVGERAGRRLGLAAAVLLMVGGLGYLGIVMVQQAGGPPPALPTESSGVTGRGIAHHEAGPGGNPDDARIAEASRIESTGSPGATRLASGETLGPPEPTAELLAMESAEPGAAAASVFEEIDADRALALAREGRLIIRVRTTIPEQTLAWLDRVARTGEGVRRDQALASRLASVIEPTPIEWYPSRDLPPMIYANGGEELPGSGIDREALGMGPLGPPRIAEIVLSELELDARALERARSALSRQPGQSAVFGESPEPTGERVVDSPRGVLWWLGGAEEWLPRTRVPIVVETRR